MGVTKPRKLKGNKNYMYTQENIEKDWSSNSLLPGFSCVHRDKLL
jgi:hypothetical protein